MKQAELIKKLKSVPAERSKELIRKLTEDGSEYNVFPLSAEQRRMAFLQNYTEYGRYSYICPYEIQVDSPEKLKKAEEAINGITAAYVSLRTLYFNIGGRFFQTICPAEECVTEFSCEDLSDIYSNSQEEYAALIKERTMVPFDLEQELPIRCFSVKKAEDKYSLYVVMHHICHDAWSIGLLMKSMQNHFNTGRALPEENSYIDYVKWHETDECRAMLAKQLDFWRETLKGHENSLLGLKSKTLAADEEPMFFKAVTLDAATDSRVTELLRQWNGTPFNFFLSVFFTVLMGFFNKTDMNVGIVTLNRSDPRFLSTFGFFVNTIVINGQWKGDMSFRDYFSFVSERSMASLNNQDISFETVVDEICSDRDKNMQPLFDVMYSFYGRNLVGGEAARKYEFEFTNLPQGSSSQYDIFLKVEQYRENTQIAFLFNKDKLPEEWAERFSEEYSRVLFRILDDPALTLDELRDKSISESFYEAENAVSEEGGADTAVVSSSVRDDINEKIVKIVEEVLETKCSSEEESFFQIGCNSMNSIIMLERINCEFGLELNISELFRYSSIALLAGYIRKLTKVGADEDSGIFLGEF